MTIMPSRRRFLSALGSLPFVAWFPRLGLAGDMPNRVRYDARSDKGIEMLKIYADATRKMNDAMQMPEGDPRSWLFQWYTHQVNDQTTKDAEIARLYPNQNDPNRAAALAMWDTCQAHGDDQNEDHFLPWHRCFIYYFEQIIAAVSGKPDFTLPYWNYSTSDPTIRGVIPPQFTKKDDPDFGPLFDGLRRQAVNDGQPIQKGSQGDPLSLSALNQTNYSPNGAEPGFNQALDFGLHGAVHVLVGGPKNMGNVPTAARDPIFWLHHCNIDRLWASWNAVGNVNPPLKQKFTFADGQGKAINAEIAEFLDLTKLNYTYDRFEPVNGPVPQPKMVGAVKPAREPVAAAAPPTGTRLTAAPTKITLTPSMPDASVAERITAVGPGKRVYLVASELRAMGQPDVLYSLYLDLPDKATAQQKADHFVGTLNFFGAAHKDQHALPKPHAEPGAVRAKFVSYDVTGMVRALGKNKILRRQPVLTIIPEGNPSENGRPVVGKIELVVQ